MKKFIGRLASALLLSAAAVAFTTPSAGWADPINCDAGQYWTRSGMCASR